MGKADANGFTLLEILIAMAIFTLIGVGSTTFLSFVIDSNEQSGERFEQLQALQRAMLVIERDLQYAVARPIRLDGEVNDIVMFGGDAENSDHDGIGLVRSGWSNPQFMLPRSTLQYVAYGTNEGNLERVSGTYLDNVVGYEPINRVVLKNVEDFQVEFFVGGQDDNSLRWNESYTGTVLPKGVAITIELETFGTVRREFTLAGPPQ